MNRHGFGFLRVEGVWPTCLKDKRLNLLLCSSPAHALAIQDVLQSSPAGYDSKPNPGL